MVAVVALFSAISGICIGCIAWKQLMRRGGSAHDLKKAFDLQGKGPWLIVVTAPENAEALIGELAARGGRDARVIGEIVPGEPPDVSYL